MKILATAVIVTADALAVVYCARAVYYTLRGRLSPEAAWATARIRSRHLDREYARLLRGTDHR